MRSMLASCVLLLLASGSTPGARQAETFPLEVLGNRISLEVDPAAKTIVGTAVVEVVALENGVTTIPFALHGDLKLTAVTEGEADVPFTEGEHVSRGRIITLTPEPSLATKKPRTFTFRYAGPGLDPGAEHRDALDVLIVRPDEIRMHHQARWYPLVTRDAEGNDTLAAPVELELVLPAGMESLGPGLYDGKKKREEREVHTWSARQPIRASILAGSYGVKELKSGSRRLRILSFPDHTDGAKAWAKAAEAALKSYDKWLGKANEVCYGIAEMRVRNRAQAYDYEADGFSVFDGERFDGRDVDPRKVAHAVAHLWWGGMIAPGEHGHGFLTESLAEFSALHYLEEVGGEEVATSEAKQLIDWYLKKHGPEESLAKTSPSRSRYEQVVHAKGAMALRTLYFWAGAKDFDAGLKLYLKRFRSAKNAPALADFLEAMRAKCGEQVDRWGDEWARRVDAPHYVATYTMAGELGGTNTVTVTLRQRGEVYTNPVEVDVVLQNGGTERILIVPRANEASQFVVVRDLVHSLVLDPRALVLSLDRAD